MSRIWKQFCALALLTAREAVREPVVLLLTAGCAAFTALMPLLLTQTLGGTERLVRDSGLALMFVGGLFLAGYAAGALLRREMNTGALALIMSKPVAPAVFYFARYAGLALALLYFCLVQGLAILMATRAAHTAFSVDLWVEVPLLVAPLLALLLAGGANFRLRRPFVTLAFWLLGATLALAFAGTGWVDDEGRRCAWMAAYSLAPLPAMAMIGLALLMLAAAALALAIRLELTPLMSLLGALFLLGLVSDYSFGRQAGHTLAAAIAYTLLPDWQIFWGADALSAGSSIPALYLAWAALYALLYTGGLLALGLALFRNSPVKA